jgi:hypothetical protein
MYRDSVVSYKVRTETRDVKYGIGVKQGDNMAPVLFINLMKGSAETLANKWKFNKLEFSWFPKWGNENKRGKIDRPKPQSCGKKIRSFLFFIYVDDGTMLFHNRHDLVEGTKFIMAHFASFRLEMHVGQGDKKSKTECVLFPAFENDYKNKDTSKFDENDGFVQFTKKSGTLDP